MFNRAPKDYMCPICLGIKGLENENTLLKQSDLVYKDYVVSVFINSFFIENNPGHVIIVTNEHFENIYDLPSEIASKVLGVAQNIAIAIKNSYQCEGITLLQNNEPASDQHTFHYHLHIFPRYMNDRLFANLNSKKLAIPEERKPYADKLKTYLNSSLNPKLQ